MLQQKSTDLADAQSRARKVPEVSVIMPVYNTRQEWLDTAIGSILGQTFKDFELIIIDDGSDETTQRQLSGYKDSRIVYLRLEENMKAAIARNEGLKIARGQYIAFMDSDDISLPERLEKQVEYMESHPGVGLVGTRIGDAEHPRRAERLREGNCSEQIECDLLLVGNVYCTSSVMVRREVLHRENVQFCADCVLAEDYKMWLDLLGRTEFGKMDDVLVRYRKRELNPKREEQEGIVGQIQFEALTGRFGVEKDKAEALVMFLRTRNTFRDGERMETVVKHIVEQLEAGGYEREYVQKALWWAIRKVYYHTRTLVGQIRLMQLPLGKIVRLGPVWRLWCLVTRGIL